MKNSDGGSLMRSGLVCARFARTRLVGACSRRFGRIFAAGAALLFTLMGAATGARAQESAGGEASLKLPDLSQVDFLGVDGHKLRLWGLLFCVFGLAFGMTIYIRLKNL